MNKNRVEIYHEDCEFLRHQNNLKWSRFKTASSIEGLVLFGIYMIKDLELTELRLVMILGFFLVFLVLLITLRDNSMQNNYLSRIKEFEKNNDAKFTDKYPNLLKGNNINLLIMILMNAINIFIVFIKW